MAMGREGEVQGELVMSWAEMPRSPGHAFYDKLQTLLTEGGFDGFVQTTCKPYYAPRWERRHCRRAAISACTWSGILKGSTAKGASCGAAPTRIRCGISCGLRTGTRFRTTPGCRRRAADCRTRFMRKCSAGSWPWSPSAVW